MQFLHIKTSMVLFIVQPSTNRLEHLPLLSNSVSEFLPVQSLHIVGRDSEKNNPQCFNICGSSLASTHAAGRIVLWVTEPEKLHAQLHSESS